MKTTSHIYINQSLVIETLVFKLRRYGVYGGRILSSFVDIAIAK